MLLYIVLTNLSIVTPGCRFSRVFWGMRTGIPRICRGVFPWVLPPGLLRLQFLLQCFFGWIRNDAKPLKYMARPERFELPTFWFVARRSIQLSYGRERKSQYSNLRASFVAADSAST